MRDPWYTRGFNDGLAQRWNGHCLDGPTREMYAAGYDAGVMASPGPVRG